LTTIPRRPVAIARAGVFPRLTPVAAVCIVIVLTRIGALGLCSRRRDAQPASVLNGVLLVPAAYLAGRSVNALSWIVQALLTLRFGMGGAVRVLKTAAERKVKGRGAPTLSSVANGVLLTMASFVARGRNDSRAFAGGVSS